MSRRERHAQDAEPHGPLPAAMTRHGGALVVHRRGNRRRGPEGQPHGLALRRRGRLTPSGDPGARRTERHRQAQTRPGTRRNTTGWSASTRMSGSRPVGMSG